MDDNQQEFDRLSKEFDLRQEAFQRRESTDRERVQGMAFQLDLHLVSTKGGGYDLCDVRSGDSVLLGPERLPKIEHRLRKWGAKERRPNWMPK
jgi:hypothetical protein